jgi:branched-chain amino acid transport system ATP-binding protein
MTLLRLESISRNFGSLAALSDISLEMEERELRAVIGPNGAGKTTLFNLVSGFFPPSNGRVWFCGRDVNPLRAVDRVRHGIVRTFQVTEIFPELTVFENLRIGVEAARGWSAKPWLARMSRRGLDLEIEDLMELSGLSPKADRTVSELAHGDQRVVEVAMALSLRPKLLLLDEPTAGMADQETDSMVALIRRLHRERGLSILFIEHDMHIVFGLADRITVLDQGRTLAEGTAVEITADERVKAAYLGEAA